MKKITENTKKISIAVLSLLIILGAGMFFLGGSLEEPVIPSDPIEGIAESPFDESLEECSKDWDPVCGVDGQTYNNECFAKGVEISYKGECPPKNSHLYR